VEHQTLVPIDGHMVDRRAPQAFVERDGQLVQFRDLEQKAADLLPLDLAALPLFSQFLIIIGKAN
jgi:hypothetical protein